jgi:mannose-6-phosphate isomerase-like protein (cupin superfamily)
MKLVSGVAHPVCRQLRRVLFYVVLSTPATAPAALHEKDAELFVVLQGVGNIVTGGKLVDEKRVNAANLSGSSIADGHSQALVKGDVLIVPNNTAV